MSRIVYRITDEYALVSRKGTANLYLEWREGGQKVARATGCSSLDDAKRRARELILELAELQDEPAEEVPIMAVLDRYWLKHGANLPSKTTVKRAIADLTAHGYLKKEPQFRENGSSSSNLYSIEKLRP